MKSILYAVLAISVASFALGAVTSERLQFETLGFSIDALQAEPGPAPYQALTMALPPSAGFAPNVNVQIQPYPGTIDEYVRHSKQQFAAAGLTVIQETKVGPNSVSLEYSGAMQGRQLHWYAKAISTGATVYLATGTASGRQWSTAGAKLKECVDSFTVE